MGNIVTVNFRGDELYGFENDYGTFVALKPIVESMGMDWSSQLQRIKRDPILSEGMVIMTTPFGRGGSQDAVCLKLELVNGWLFTIDTSRIKNEDVRERVMVYQRECYAVLSKHFYGRSFGERHASLNSADSFSENDEPLATRRQIVTETRQTFGVLAAREMWFKLSLPTVSSMFADPAQGDFFNRAASGPDNEAA